MKPLSQQLAELSVVAKNAEDRAARAQSEAKEHVEQAREQLQQETRAALDKVGQGLSRISAEAQGRVFQLKTKVDSDFAQLKQRAVETRQKFETWQAKAYAEDLEAEAAASIDYAIASVRMADLAVLDAIDARQQAETKEEQMRAVQPTAS